ncbi:hypothetical protein [Vibrio ezurae]|uniref:Uncharacterized protein n=1 Tax=Vibrio ezurae NBRC 102218 TaxID=1219080 RepID=U3AJY8_9VIBR|nr:hypothetical protein [Vibrio ezurae]GAD80236.1 hypothetical protein VEZ01S_28_00190 [Vibrio ezurae NBRC 102218]
MNAKKALKKLKKKSEKKIKKQGVEQLKKLKVNATNSRRNDSSSALKKDINDSVNRAITGVVHELATPLLPVLSWFNDHQHKIEVVESPLREQLENSTSSSKPIPSPQKSILHVALKSPPCKRCPALQNGICKCAAKRFKLSA